MSNGSGFGRLDWGNWLYGLISAIIGGGMTSLGTGLANIVVDPVDFNIYQGLHKLLTVMLVSFLLGAIATGTAFLKTQPLPPVLHTETATVKTDPFGATTTTTKKTEINLPPEQK